MATVTTMVKMAELTAAASKPISNVKPANTTTANTNQRQYLTSPSSSTVSLSTQSLQMAAAPVSYVDNIKLTKDKTLDPLLAGGSYWFHTAGGDGSTPSAVADHTLTYSFLSSASNSSHATGFAALTDGQKDTIRDALTYISSLVDITFTEVGSGADISYGTNDQTATSSAGYATYPGSDTVVYLANNVSSFSGSWDPGSYTWSTILHETAHALGLKHPGNYNAGGGGTPKPYLAKSLDNTSNSIMSYNADSAQMTRISYNGSAFSKTTVNPDSFRALDIAALQYLYGAPSSVDAVTYSFDADEIFSRTIWNSNAASGIDLSNQTAANFVDLRAGNFSSIAKRDAYADMDDYFSKEQYAALTSGGKKLTKLIGVPTYTGTNNLSIAKGSNINNFTGGSGADTVITNTSSNVISTGDGSDAVYVSSVSGGTTTSIDGGSGDDTVYVAKAKNGTWTLDGNALTLTRTKTDKVGSAGEVLATVNLTSIEHIQIWDGKKMKANGTPILAAPIAKQIVVAYSNAPAPASTINIKA